MDSFSKIIYRLVAHGSGNYKKVLEEKIIFSCIFHPSSVNFPFFSFPWLTFDEFTIWSFVILFRSNIYLHFDVIWFQHASACLWNQLPASFCQPRPNHSPSHSSHPNHLSSSLPSSPLSLSITPTLLNSKTQNLPFKKSFPSQTPPLPSDCFTDSGLLNNFLQAFYNFSF